MATTSPSKIIDILGTVPTENTLGQVTIPVAPAFIDNSLSPEQEAQRKAMLAITSKLNSIEEKSSCGGVMFLDKVADFLERRSKNLHNLSLKVRNRTAKMSAPCSITFKKK